MEPSREFLPPLSSEAKIEHCSSTLEETRRTRTPRDSAENGSDTWRLDGDGDAWNDLNTKLAHVQWRKLANDKNIRKAIDTSKRMRERDLLLQLCVDREGERARWTEAIVRDELARPAEISEMFLKNWEQQAAENRKRQLKETKLHLRSLKRVERAVQSKKPGTTMAPYESGSTEGRGRESEEPSSSSSTNVLQEKLKSLRIGIKERRRDLRRCVKKDISETFSASSFKTGRGKW